ncbi:MAG: VTT domain-containing protein [Patescibacteria group bacterium]
MPAELISLLLLFLVCLLTPTISFGLPVRPVWLLLLLSAQINWLVVASVGAIGATLGAIPLYYISREATKITKVKKWLDRRWLSRFIEHFKNRPFFLIIILILTPLPDQLLGIIGGVQRYQLRTYLLANLVGRYLFCIPFALVGYFLRGNVNDLADWFVRLIGI